MYSDYITKWVETTTGGSYTTGRIDMPVEISIPNTENNPYKLKVAYRYNGTVATNNDRFYIYYVLNGSGGRNSVVYSLAGSKYVRPVLYTDSTGLYYGVQCYNSAGEYMGMNKVLINSSPTSTIRVTSMQNAGGNYTVFTETIIGQKVKNLYNTIRKISEFKQIKNTFNTVKSIASKLTEKFNTNINVKGTIKNTYDTISYIDGDRKWVLTKEYVKSITTLDATVIPSQSFNEYTEDNPYFYNLALYTLPTNSTSARISTVRIGYGIDGNTSGYVVSVSTLAEADYHRPAIFKNTAGKVVFALYGYTKDGELVGIANTAIARTGNIGFSNLQLYSGYGYFDIYTNKPINEVEEVTDHNPNEYKFSNEAATYTNEADEDHTLQKYLIEYSYLDTAEVELPFYGIRRTYANGYPYIRWGYSINGAEEVIDSASPYTFTSYNFKYIKIGFREINSQIYPIFYVYDENGDLLQEAKPRFGIAGTLKNTKIRLIGMYCNVSRVHNYKQNIVQKYPISHKYNTHTKIYKKYTHNFDTFKEVVSSIPIKKCFDTVINTVQVLDKKYNTKLSINKDYTSKHTTSRQVNKSIKIKTTYNTSSRTVKDVSARFDIMSSIKAPIKNVFDTVFMIGQNIKTTHDTSRNVYAGCKTNYNTKKEVKCTSRETYNTRQAVDSVVKAKYNTTIKTECKVESFYNSVKSVYGKVTKEYNTTTEIMTAVSNKYNTNLKVENRIRKEFDTNREVKLEHRKIFDAKRTTINRVKSKYNTERTIRYFVMARYNTQRETDILAVIKMLLGITDSSQDSVLRFLVFKAIEDIHANCNLDRGTLTRAKETNPTRRDVFAEEEAGYYSATSELGTNRHLQNILIDLVIYYYRMRGMEHLKNESIEGGSWNYIYESIPPQIVARLKPYKKAPKLRVF